MTYTLPEKTKCYDCVFFEPCDPYDHTSSMMRDGHCRIDLPPYFPDFNRAVDDSDGCTLGKEGANYDRYGDKSPFEPVPALTVRMDGVVSREQAERDARYASDMALGLIPSVLPPKPPGVD